MNYVISGKVIKGDGYGEKLGFPTINLRVEKGELPDSGIYAGIVALDAKEYRAGIVVGPENKMEAHLLGYDGDAYGKQATLEVNKFIRKFRKFKTEKELIAQIRKDLKACLRV